MAKGKVEGPGKPNSTLPSIWSSTVYSSGFQLGWGVVGGGEKRGGNGGWKWNDTFTGVAYQICLHI